MSIVTEYPFWFIIFCLALGAGLATILYYKDTKNDFSHRLLLALTGLRFMSVSLIAFLLLSPLLKTLVKQVEKPVIIIAQDQSESILINRDSSFYKNDYPDVLRTLIRDLGKKFDVRSYSFGDRFSEEINFRYNQKTTNITDLVDEIQTRYAHRNVGALVIASDGLYNKGINPLYSSEKVTFPVYTIAMGDTTPQKDLLIAKVNYNRTTILGNKFPVEILVRASQFPGSSCSLKVLKGDQILFSKNITINSVKYLETINLQLDAKEAGLQRYRIRLSQLPAEISLSNNEQDIFVNVLQGKEKILILTAVPHPDVAALKDGIESNANYEVKVSNIDEFSETVNPYNLVILNQLPSARQNAASVISKAADGGIPILYILGAASNLPLFNTLKTGLSVQQDKVSFTESQPALKNDFALFTLSDETRKLIQDFPPLNCPFGNYKTQNSASTLFYQKIGNLVYDRPLLLFGQEPTRKYGVIAGEGLWKWKLFVYSRKNNHDAFNELITKTIQYLSVRVTKDFFKVNCSHQFQENEPVTMSAEVYNPSYELITDPEIELTITNEDNKTFPFSFTKGNNAYQLNAGLFPPGTYRYMAQTKISGKIYQVKGEFTIAPVHLENVNTTADFSLLFNLAHQHNGEMVLARDAQKLTDLLLKREDIKNISYTQKRFNDWINLPWVFLLLLLLLSAEWFLRKRAGSY
ncbi:MAG: hypothetical protein NTU44_04740 [Bacteroidetes bacterium]|nr:hypothetical protein [Bacteroidota bacterium]